MTTPSDSAVAHPEAHVATGVPVNVLRRSISLAGVLLWPCWRDPARGTASARVGTTGPIENHWRYTPGQLNAPPQAPAWAQGETITPGEYDYDRQYAGMPLSGVDVDLFHADAGVDFDDHALLARFYAVGAYLRDARVKRLKIRFTKVDVIDDGDQVGAGELVFEGSIDGRSVGKTPVLEGNSGQRGLALVWPGPQSGVIEVDVTTRRGPIALALSCVELDPLSTEALGRVAAEIQPPWTKVKASGSAATANFVAHWEIEPVLMTEEEKAASPPDASSSAGATTTERLAEAFIATRRTAVDGRFEFRGLRAGEYVLHARSRLTFVETLCPGGEVGPTPAHQHNGVRTAALGAAKGRHSVHLKLKVDASGGVQRVTTRAGAESASSLDRLLAEGQTLGDIREGTPYRIYALPLVVATNKPQWDACADELRHAFELADGLPRVVAAIRAQRDAILAESHGRRAPRGPRRWIAAQGDDDRELLAQIEQARVAMEASVRAAMETTAILDVSALQTWDLAGGDAATVIADGAAVDAVLQRTLLVGGRSEDQRTTAYDHVYWRFAARDAAERTRGRFVPLDVEGFFGGANHLYDRAAKTKDTYGRFALRFVRDHLSGRDIRELKTRLVLWGSRNNFVDMSDDVFNVAVREALLRFKWDREVFRRRVNAADGSPDASKCVVTTIVDGDTYAALDLATPPLTLSDVVDTNDPGFPNTPLLNAEGYCRLVFYAAEIARRRIDRVKTIRVHSSFRTLAHNRREYLQSHDLRWRLKHDAPASTFNYGPFTTVVGGVLGADGTHHNAQAAVTSAAMIYDEQVAPRGTYVNGVQTATFVPQDHWAPDYSKHTRGSALDFCLAAPPAVHAASVAQVQWDTNAIRLFGAVRGGSPDEHLWLEPPSSASFPGGTTDWIHLDTGALPKERLEFVLADADILGPRWHSNLIVRGRVTRGGAPRLGARVELLDGATPKATTYTNEAGEYSLRVEGGAVRGGYTVRATFQMPYAFQPPQPQAAAVTTEIPITFAHAGDEMIGVDLALPA